MPSNVGGEITFAEAAKATGVRGEDKERILASYLITYIEDAFACAIDSDWTASVQQYELGVAQIPRDLTHKTPFDTIASLMRYNALVARIMSTTFTKELQDKLAEHVESHNTIFSRQTVALPTRTARRSAAMIMATCLHEHKQYDSAASWYARLAGPGQLYGIEAARGLRRAWNHLDLPTEHSLPGVLRLTLQRDLSLAPPVVTHIVRYGHADDVLSQLTISTLQQGINFEEKCLALVRAMGFVAKTTAKTGDGGIDILAFSPLPLLSGEVVIQCKDWRTPIGEPVLRDLYGTVSARQAIKGICITSGRFTQQARVFAQGLQLELVDGTQLDYWIARYQSETANDTLVPEDETGAIPTH